MRTKLLLIGLMLLAGGGELGAQDAPPTLEVGDWIRVTTAITNGPMEGDLVRLRGDTLRYRPEYGINDVPLADILRLELRTRQSTRWLAGGIVGGVLGGTYGGIAAHQLSNEDTSKIIEVTVVGTAIGFGLGALVGRSWSNEVWRILRVESLNGVRVEAAGGR